MLKKIINLGGLNALSQGFYRISILIIYMFSTSGNMKAFAVNSTLITFLTVFQSLGVAGLSLAANTYIPKYKNEENIYAKAIINISFLLAVFVSIISFFSIDFFLDKIIKSNDFGYLNYHFLSIFIFVLCVSGVFKGFYYAKEKVNYLVLTSLVSALGLLFSYFILNLGLLFSYLVSVVVEFVCLFIFLFKVLNIIALFRVEVSLVYYKKLFSFIIPASASGLVLMPVNILVLYILGLFNSSLIISVFNYGMQIRNLIIFFPSVLGSIFLKILSENDNKKEFKFMLFVNSLIALVISIFLLIAKTLGLPYLKLIGYSDLIILCLGSILFSVNSVIGNKIVALLKTKVGFYFNILWALSFITFTYVSFILGLLSPFLGLFLAYIVLTIVQFWYVRVYINE
ncbi:hypothetical protein [Acinetobacter pittii]|uniref:hypothetical protein n=1 Tax=Acinetobacter pittii TaxID=48296 RepID=UPI003AA7E27D